MNTKQDTVQVILDNDIELDSEQIEKLNKLHRFIEDSEKFIQAHKETLEAMGGLKELEGNVGHCQNEVVDTIFDGYTTWYKQHNPDIANMAMYKLAFALESDDHAVSNTTYGNDCCASITLDFDCYNRSIQIFIPNSTKFDDDNEEYDHYYVCPKDEHEENIEAQSKMFDMHDIQGIVKYCEKLYKLFQAEHDLKKLQA